MQDRKPLTPQLEIPQSLQDQAEMQLKFLEDPGSSSAEAQAEMVKAPPVCRLVIFVEGTKYFSALSHVQKHCTMYPSTCRLLRAVDMMVQYRRPVALDHSCMHI